MGSNNIISCGYSHTILIKEDGTAWSFGYNRHGQLGLGDLNCKTTPQRIDIDDIVSGCRGENHTILLKRDGTVWSLNLGL